MHIGLLFGSFNPVHNGHLIIAQSMMHQCQWDEVWLIPSPQNPFKSSHELLAFEHRYLLLQQALRNEKHIRVCDAERDLPVPSYTIDTMKILSARYPDFQFHIIMGSDQLSGLAKWKEANTLIKSYPIHVYARPGYAFKQGTYSHLQMHSLPLLDISATEIRKRLLRNESVTGMIAPAAEAVIKRNGWYKSEF